MVVQPASEQPAEGPVVKPDPIGPPAGPSEPPSSEPLPPEPSSQSPGFAGSSVPADLVPPSPEPPAAPAGSVISGGVLPEPTVPPATVSSVPEPLPGAPEPPAALPPLDEVTKDPEGDLPLPVAMPADPLPLGMHKRRKKGLILGLIITAGVLLLSGGAAASYFYYAATKPENILKQALANTLDSTKAKTVSYSGSLTTEQKGTTVKVEGTFKGNINNETGAFDMSASLDAFVTKLTLDARSVDGKTYYFKVGGLDGLFELITGVGGATYTESQMAPYAGLIKALNNQWLEVNESLIKQYAGKTITPDPLSEADRTKIAEAYNQNSFVVIKEELASEAIKGADSHHYKVGIDKAKFKAFVAALKNAKLEVLKLSDEELRLFNESVDKANLDNTPVELWVSKADKMIRQIELTANENDAVTKVRLTIDSYNQSFTVQKPANAKSVLELIGDFFGGPGLTQQMEQLNLQSQLEGGGISL